MSSAPASRDFYIHVERWRRAMMMSCNLTASTVLTGLLLLIHTNRQRFDQTGDLVTWVGKRRLAALTSKSESSIKVAFRHLCTDGVIELSGRGGKGPSDTNLYQFSRHWLEAAERTLDADDLLRLWPDKRLSQVVADKGGEPDPLKGTEYDPNRGAKSASEYKERDIDFNLPKRAYARVEDSASAIAKQGDRGPRNSMGKRGRAAEALDAALDDLCKAAGTGGDDGR